MGNINIQTLTNSLKEILEIKFGNLATLVETRIKNSFNYEHLDRTAFSTAQVGLTKH